MECGLTKKECIYMEHPDCNICIIEANRLKTVDGTVTDDEGNIIKIND